MGAEKSNCFYLNFQHVCIVPGKYIISWLVIKVDYIFIQETLHYYKTCQVNKGLR